MLLTITNTQTPAADIGYLFHKNPARVHTFDLSFGKARVFYPEASDEQCTMAMLLDVDPIGLVRNRRGGSVEGGLDQYVNDRPYVASSFLSVAIARVLGTALAGNCAERPGLVNQALPLSAKIAVLPCRGGEVFLRKLFEPLGYNVTATHHPLDEQFAEWGEGPYYTVALEKRCTVQELLTHLYVLIPVLDTEKHYWVGQDEVEKLLRKGEGWLPSHPEREAIVNRYLRYQKRLTREALERLTAEEEPDEEAESERRAEEEAGIEKPLKLKDHRLRDVVSALEQVEARRVLDLGCGEGALLRELLKHRQLEEIVGMDVSHRSLEIASQRLRLETLPPRQKQRIRLFQGSLMYRDQRLAGFDAACVVEVIEHLDPPRLAAFERVLFECARPGTVVITTPNAEYNVRFATLPAGQFRHRDHRFEWTRAQFQEWASEVSRRFGYAAELRPVGEADAEVGAPTQMCVFRRQ